MESAAVESREKAAIVDVVLDYFEGWFTGDEERMRRALHPRLAKRRLADDEAGLVESTTAGMIEATAAGAGVQPLESTAIEVEVVDVYDPIATVVVRSTVYREYVQLVRTSEGWKIVNTLYVRTAA